MDLVDIIKPCKITIKNNSDKKIDIFMQTSSIADKDALFKELAIYTSTLEEIAKILYDNIGSLYEEKCLLESHYFIIKDKLQQKSNPTLVNKLKELNDIKVNKDYSNIFKNCFKK